MREKFIDAKKLKKSYKQQKKLTNSQKKNIHCIKRNDNKNYKDFS